MTAQSQHRLLNQLRAHGIRLTAQRVVLMNILEAEDGFVDAETLCALARRKGTHVDRSTVYRTLALLRANGLLASTLDGSGVPDRAVDSVAVGRDEMGLLCERCRTRQAVVAHAPDAIKQELQRSTGFYARAIRLEARGECRLCAAKARLSSKIKKTN